MRSTDIVEVARSWLGTPFKHQGRVKGHGVDCAGLVVSVGLESGALELTDEEVKRLFRYHPSPRPSRVRAGLERHAHRVLVPEEGDIAYISWGRGKAYHLGVIVGITDGCLFRVVNARGDVGRVVEEDFEFLNQNLGMVDVYRYGA